MNELKNIIVTTKQLAAILEVSESYISDLVNDHQMPKLGFNKFPLVDCIKFRINHLQKIYDDKIIKHRDLTNRGRLEAAQAELKEIELKKIQGTLAPIEDFKIIFTNWSQLFKKSVENIGTTLKFDINLNDEEQQIVNNKINNILTQLSQLPVNIDVNSFEFK